MCSACRSAQRRERYALDPAFRLASKQAHNRWRTDHLDARAAYMRTYRARAKESLD